MDEDCHTKDASGAWLALVEAVMTPEQIARGRRAVEIVNGRWRPGMRVRIGTYWGRLTKKGDRLVRVYEHSGFVAAFPPAHNPPDVFLDVEDPATLGCLVALAREALEEPGAHAVKYAYHWGIERHDSYSEGPQALRHDGAWDATWCADAVSGLDEPEAWLAALEAAGRR